MSGGVDWISGGAEGDGCPKGGYGAAGRIVRVSGGGADYGAGKMEREGATKPSYYRAVQPEARKKKEIRNGVPRYGPLKEVYTLSNRKRSDFHTPMFKMEGCFDGGEVDTLGRPKWNANNCKCTIASDEEAASLCDPDAHYDKTTGKQVDKQGPNTVQADPSKGLTPVLISGADEVKNSPDCGKDRGKCGKSCAQPVGWWGEISKGGSGTWHKVAAGKCAPVRGGGSAKCGCHKGMTDIPCSMTRTGTGTGSSRNEADCPTIPSGASRNLGNDSPTDGWCYPTKSKPACCSLGTCPKTVSTGKPICSLEFRNPEFGEWSNCSNDDGEEISCGNGVKKRACSPGSVLSDLTCASIKAKYRIKTEEACSLGPCPAPGSWVKESCFPCPSNDGSPRNAIFVCSPSEEYRWGGPGFGIDLAFCSEARH